MSTPTNDSNSNNSPVDHKANFDIAKGLLTEGEKTRILAIYLHTGTDGINWANATTAFGAASVDSMKVSTRNILKKLESGGATAGGEATVGAGPRAGKGKKRKAGAAEASLEDEGGVGKVGVGKKRKVGVSDGEEEKEKPKKGRGRAKKAVDEAAGSASGAGEGVIKAEEGDED